MTSSSTVITGTPRWPKGNHLLCRSSVCTNIDGCIGNSLFIEERFCHPAVRAVLSGINGDRAHQCEEVSDEYKYYAAALGGQYT